MQAIVLLHRVQQQFTEQVTSGGCLCPYLLYNRQITLACIAHIITMPWSCIHHTYYYSCKNVYTTYYTNPTRVIGGRIGDRSREWHDGGWNFSIWNQCIDYVAPNRTGRVLTGNVIAVRQSTEDMVAIECIICNEPNGCLPRPLHGTTLVGKYCI